MANKSVLMASSLIGDAFESIDVDLSVSDTDSWQVVGDNSDSDDGNYSFDDVNTDGDDVIDDENEVVPDVDDLLQQPFGSPVSDISVRSLVDEITHHCQELNEATKIDHNRQMIVEEAVINGGDDPYAEDDHHDDHVEDSEEDDDDSDLDDELVPKWLSNKFERQRMRKLGKRAYPKMKKSKRMVNQYNRPGCVHGKHGLGLKHNLIW